MRKVPEWPSSAQLVTGSVCAVTPAAAVRGARVAGGDFDPALSGVAKAAAMQTASRVDRGLISADMANLIEIPPRWSNVGDKRDSTAR
jgi:hypothetical protein